MANELTREISNNLVIYSTVLDISDHIKVLNKPLSEINLEHRIIVDNGMYVGGFKKIKIDNYGIDGKTYLRFFKALGSNVPGEETLTDRVIKELFDGKLDNPDDVDESNGVKYVHDWSVGIDPYSTRIIRAHNHHCEPNPEILEELKNDVVNKRNIVISSKFLVELFGPLYPPLIKAYHQIKDY